MSASSLKEWLDSGMAPSDFPEIPESQSARFEFIRELVTGISRLDTSDLEIAVSRLPAILGDLIERSMIVRELDEVATNQTSPRKFLLLGELAVDFLILDEEWRECIPRLDRLIEVARNAGMADELSILFNYRGVCLYRLARYPEAQNDLEESLRIADEIDSDRRRARASINLGLVLKEMGRLEDAAGYYKRALALAGEIGDDRTLLSCYLNIGNIYKELGRWDDGRKALEKGIELAGKLGEAVEVIRGRLNLGVLIQEQDERLEDAVEIFEGVIAEAGDTGAEQLASIARSNLALALVKLGRADESVELSRSSLEKAESESDPEGAWRAAANLGRAYALLGSIDEADRSFLRAMDAFDSLRKGLASDRDRIEYQRNLRELLSEYINFSLDHLGVENAFARLARGKSRALMQSRESKVSPDGGAAVEDAETPDRIRDSISRHPGSILLDFLISGTDLGVFVLDDSDLTHHRLPVSIPEIQQLLQDFYRDIGLFIASAEYRDAQRGKDIQPPEALIKLEAALIEPVRHRIGASQHLWIVPQGILHAVPFAALADKEGRYLIESKSFSILPASDFLTAANPGSLPESDRAVILQGGKEGLEAVDREIEEIGGLFGAYAEVADLSAVLLRDGLAGLNNLLKRATVIHFAGHAEFDRTDPFSSALVLDDGTRLGISELGSGELDLSSARLVSLAGCETGVGEILAGDESVGLARAFLAAGADSVLVSLWKVSDEAACELMPEFYQAWQSGLSMPDALKSAINNMLLKAREHPYFFAAFYIVGSG